MNKVRKLLIGIGVLGVLILSAGFLKKSLQVESITVETKEVTDTFTQDGVVSSGNEVSILSEVTGNVKEVYVDNNTYVRQGTIVATIDTTDYEYQKRLNENNIASYQAKIDEILYNEKNSKEQIKYSIDELKEEIKTFENNNKTTKINNVINATPQDYITLLELSLELSTSDYQYSKINYDNIKALYDINAVSKTQLDEAKNAYIKAQTALLKAQTQLASSKAQLEQLSVEGIDETTLNTYFYKYQQQDMDSAIEAANIKMAALEQKLSVDYSTNSVRELEAAIENEKTALKQTQDRIEECAIVTKYSGYVSDLPIKDQTAIHLSDTVIKIKTEDVLTVETDVLTTSVPYLAVGDAVTITQKLRGEDVHINGKIKEIYNYATQGVSALGLEEYKVKVIIEVEDKESKLKSGYQVDVTFTTYQQDNQMAIPNSALFEIDDKDYVFKVENKRAVLTPIEVGYKTNTETVVKRGLSLGDQVVFDANTQGLYDGVAVSVTSKE